MSEERILVETSTYQSKTWEYNQATVTEFRLTENGGNTFETVTLSQPASGDETLHGTQEDICAIIAELAEISYEEAEGKHLAFFHNGHGDCSAEEAINPIEFFAGQAENDRNVADLEVPGLYVPRDLLSIEDFSVAIDSARKTLGGWSTGGRDLEEYPITTREIRKVATETVQLYGGSSQDVADLISQLS